MASQVIESADDLFYVGFYNVGLQQSALEKSNLAKSASRLQWRCDDIGNAFRDHKLDLLGLCELGQHLKGIHGQMHFKAETQEELMELVVDRIIANKVGSSEPALVLVAGSITS